MPSLTVATSSGLREATARRASGSAVVHQQRRVDAVGQVAQLLHGGLDLGGDLVERLGGRFGVLGHQVLDQPDVHGQRHQVLLGAVVEVPFDPPPLGVSGATMRDREARSSAACRRTSSRVDCRAESRRTLWRASPT